MVKNTEAVNRVVYNENANNINRAVNLNLNLIS